DETRHFGRARLLRWSRLVSRASLLRLRRRDALRRLHAPAGRGWARAGPVLPGRPYVYGGDLYDQGRLPAPRRRARPDAGLPGYQPARRGRSRRGRGLGLRHRRGLLRGRHRGALVPPLQDVLIRNPGAAVRRRGELPGPPRCRKHLRALDGRPRRPRLPL
ncbi:MAG: S-formylglutathione hydrolase, partial [uncultured Rubrobacteraceae bacterium]